MVTLTVTDPELLTDVAGTTANSVAPDTVTVGVITDCINIAETCRSIAIVLNRTSTTQARGASVTFGLGPELQLCDAAPNISISQGDWLSGFEPNIFFAANDNGDGTYTVDQSILGSPCGTSGGGTLFTIDVKKTSGFADSVGAVTITNVMLSDCGMAEIPSVAGPDGSITIDTTLPPAITGIGVTQIGAGNDGDGTIEVTVTFDAPAPDVAAVEVWRANFGNYPEFDDLPDPGSAPVMPSLYPPSLEDPRWELTGVTASGQTDESSSRDFWSYIAIAKDDCENPRSPGDMASVLNYHLGDVTPTESPGDNQVNFFDISRLGTCYFATLDPHDPCGDADVAPTSPGGMPLTDNLVNFSDLLVFAINFDQVSMMPPSAALDTGVTGDPRLELVTRAEGSEWTRVSLNLVDNPGTLRAFHVELALEDAQLTQIDRGKLLTLQGDEVFFAHQPGETVMIDAAVLGSGAVIRGDGEVVSLLVGGFGGGSPQLTVVDLRDVEGRPVGEAQTTGLTSGSDVLGSGVPTRHELLGARPNPFNPSTEIRFRLPRETVVELRIYEVGGRLIRTLVEGRLPGGEHAIAWDGRNEQGQLLSSGVYLYAIRAGAIDAVEKLLMIK